MEIPTWNYGSICGELEYLVRVHMHAIKLEVPGKVHICDSELAIIFSQLITKRFEGLGGCMLRHALLENREHVFCKCPSAHAIMTGDHSC